MEHQQYIATYFALGLSNQEILCLLAQDHGIILSIRTLKRITSKLNLYRRKGHSDILDVALFLMTASQTSTGKGQGYRWLHRKCQENGLIVSKETVRILLCLIDPEGGKRRSRRRLARRVYRSAGPNAVWHMDGYDKLKPYGICIHGCIDGYSRNVLWLEAWNTNNDPSVIAGYFVETVKRLEGCPERIRSDDGTENRSVEQMQYLLRDAHVDRHSGQHSFLYGSSVTNQRIESWWGILRKQCIQHWMDLFKHLKEDGYYNGDFIDKNLVQFCFLEIIQKEINNVVQTWNFHSIRTSKTNPGPYGKPAVMFSLPHLYGSEDHLKSVNEEALTLCEGECTMRGEHRCDPTVYDLCTLIMEEMQCTFPEEKDDLTELYLALRREIRSELF